jgi:hypothetical protein
MTEVGKAARLATARPFCISPDMIQPRASTTPAPVVLPPVGPAIPPIPDCGPWSIGPHWPGETVFVVASGPSIADTNFELIRGRKIICVNSSYERVPFADLLYFGDGRWWEEHKKRLASFPGRIATCSGIVKNKRFLKLNRLKPETGKPETGFSTRRDMVASQRTSLQGAMNIAAHLIYRQDGPPGAIVLIGADMGRAADGRSHGHTPHKWVNRPGNVTWDEQMRHLKWIVAPLKKRHIAVVNCSTTSRIPWWPKMALQEFLTMEKLSRKGGWDWRASLGS